MQHPITVSVALEGGFARLPIDKRFRGRGTAVIAAFQTPDSSFTSSSVPLRG